MKRWFKMENVGMRLLALLLAVLLWMYVYLVRPGVLSVLSKGRAS